MEMIWGFDVGGADEDVLGAAPNLHMLARQAEGVFTAMPVHMDNLPMPVTPAIDAAPPTTPAAEPAPAAPDHQRGRKRAAANEGAHAPRVGARAVVLFTRAHRCL
jgi:hypothetical protein